MENFDYEKAYKAVLQTATQWIKDGCTDKERICLECVFPELRESEDETKLPSPNDVICSQYHPNWYPNPLEEQPVCEGLEEETEKFIETFGWGKTKHLAEKELISATARHFYELGCRRTAEKYDEIEYKRQRAEESVPSDLKDASEKEYPCDKSWMTDSMLDMNAHCQVAFWKGAKWQKEQLMKEAVEGEYDSYPAAIYLETPIQGIKHGDKVRVIIVKED